MASEQDIEKLWALVITDLESVKHVLHTNPT